MKKQVIRVGDTVRIVNSLAVRRVGYPLVWYDLLEEVEADPRTRAAYETLTGHDSVIEKREHFPILKVKEGSMPSYFLQACAKLRVEQRNFGGKERTLHYFPWTPEGQIWSGGAAPNMTGFVFSVSSKRVVKTGTRRPEIAGTTRSYDGPEDWVEPGGLDDMKTHVLLTLEGWEIEECNVELVRRGTQHD